MSSPSTHITSPIFSGTRVSGASRTGGGVSGTQAIPPKTIEITNSQDKENFAFIPFLENVHIRRHFDSLQYSSWNAIMSPLSKLTPNVYYSISESKSSTFMFIDGFDRIIYAMSVNPFESSYH